MRRSGEKRVSVKDIAKAADVSETTVVHAMNPPPNVRMKKETRDKVLRIAQEMGYKPNFMGRALVSGKTFTVGLLQPSYEAIVYIFYQKFIQSIVREMEKDNYHLLMLFRNPGHSYKKVIDEGRLDGIFILQSDPEDEHIKVIENSGLPAVVINKIYKSANPENHKIACIHSDYSLYMEKAVKELAGLGAKSILCIIEPARTESNGLIFKAFWREAGRYSAKGISFSNIANPMDRNKFREQIRNALQSGNKWDGIIANGAWVAGIYIEEAAKLGYVPGRDFNIVFDDVPDAYDSTGREYSSYLQQPDLIGAKAWEIMKNILASKNRQKELIIPYKHLKS